MLYNHMYERSIFLYLVPSLNSAPKYFSVNMTFLRMTVALSMKNVHHDYCADIEKGSGPVHFHHKLISSGVQFCCQQYLYFHPSPNKLPTSSLSSCLPGIEA